MATETSEASSPPHAQGSGGQLENEVEEFSHADSKRKTRVVEESPKKRFSRFNEKLGEGAFKRVYRAWDSANGVEVAWNAVKIGALKHNEADMRPIQEMKLLQNLDHPNIIKFFGSWLNKEAESVVFVTEFISGGNIKDFMQRCPVRLCILKKWSRAVLDALCYLHDHTPPIIHRDLKPENIFIHSSTGEISIGDFGLASWNRGNRRQSVLGTPEYMAPELYEEDYDEQVDIYAFGMCVLEIATNEAPYSECDNPAQVYRKVSCGEMPRSLDRIAPSSPLLSFVSKCVLRPAPGHRRPAASELQADSFLLPQEDDNRLCKALLVDEFAVQETCTDGAPPELPAERAERRHEQIEVVMELASKVERFPERRSSDPAQPSSFRGQSVRRSGPLSRDQRRGSGSSSAPARPEDAAGERRGADESLRRSRSDEMRPPSPSSVASVFLDMVPSPSSSEAGSEASNDWECSAQPSAADPALLDVDLRVTYLGKKVHISFQFHIHSDSATAMVDEMVREGALPEQVPSQDLGSIAEQLERMRQKYMSGELRKAAAARKRSSSMNSTGSASAASASASASDSASVPQPKVSPTSTPAATATATTAAAAEVKVDNKSDPGASFRPPLPPALPVWRCSSDGPGLPPSMAQKAAVKPSTRKARKSRGSAAEENEIRRLESRIMLEGLEPKALRPPAACGRRAEQPSCTSAPSNVLLGGLLGGGSAPLALDREPPGVMPRV